MIRTEEELEKVLRSIERDKIIMLFVSGSIFSGMVLWRNGVTLHNLLASFAIFVMLAMLLWWPWPKTKLKVLIK